MILTGPQSSTASRMLRSISNLLFLLFLTVCQLALFSASFDYFFQADSLFWLNHRLRSPHEFLEGLFSLDAHGWYRPFSLPLVPSVLFPFFGLEPFGYHLVVFILFAVSCWVFFIFFKELLGEDWQARIAILYFGTHWIHVFTTFDFAFIPELTYGFFYILSCLYFVQWQRSGKRRYSYLSLIFFLISLLSKEAAISLPGNLFLIKILLFSRPASQPHSEGQLAFFRSSRLAVKSVCVHVLVLVGYGLYVFGYLRRHLSLTKGYLLELDRNCGKNLALAFTQALNLNPRDGSSNEPLVFLLPCLTAFGIVLLVYSIASILRGGSRRKRSALGLLWFVVSLLPALPLRELNPYYLYVPLIGLSLIAGTALGEMQQRLSRTPPILARTVLVALLALLITANKPVISGNLRHHSLLGGSALIAQQADQDIQAIGPRLEIGTSILIVDREQPLWWYSGVKEVLLLRYQDKELSVYFTSLGETVPESALRSGRFLVLEYQAGHLSEITQQFRVDPGRYLWTEKSFQYANLPGPTLEVEPSEVLAGKNEYTLRVRGLENKRVEVQFCVDQGPIGIFNTQLNGRGEAKYLVGPETRKGQYSFIAVRPFGRTDWLRSKPVALLVK